jgi:hypothetical protein
MTFVQEEICWRRRPKDMEGNCKYIEEAAAGSRQGVVLQAWGWAWG